MLLSGQADDSEYDSLRACETATRRIVNVRQGDPEGVGTEPEDREDF